MTKPESGCSIVGAHVYDSGETDEGAVFVFLGSSEGRPVVAQQRCDDGSALAIQPWGRAEDLDSFEVRMIATHPEGRGRVKPEAEVCPTGVPFDDVSCTTQVDSSWTDVTATSIGFLLAESITPATPGLLYRWRACVLHAPFNVTEPAITSPPNPAHGPWRRLSGQADEADVRVVPEPGAALGLVSGMLLLAGLGRRRRVAVF